MAQGVGGGLEKAPLVYALCQVRFSSVLSIEEYIPKIQEQIRKAFPRFDKEVLQLLKLSQVGGIVEPSIANRWTFVNKENTAGFILNADALVFHTTNYLRFVDFAANLEHGLTIVDEILDISLVERIGLRYIDFIEPQANEEIESYVREHLSGFPYQNMGFNEISHKHESQSQTPAGQMTIKYMQARHNSILPHDLLPLSLQLDKVLPLELTTGILDTDHYWQDGEDFDVPKIMEILGRLHEYTNAAFRASVTDKAIESWR